MFPQRDSRYKVVLNHVKKIIIIYTVHIYVSVLLPCQLLVIKDHSRSGFFVHWIDEFYKFCAAINLLSNVLNKLLSRLSFYEILTIIYKSYSGLETNIRVLQVTCNMSATFWQFLMTLQTQQIQTQTEILKSCR